MPGQVGPAGGGGSSSSVTYSLETPSGAVNGVNDEFVFTTPPIQVFFSGQLQNGEDYSLAGSTVTFTVPPYPPGSVSGLVQS